MSQFCSVHRTPRAGIDRIDGAAAALAVIDLAVRRPLVAETIVLVLDADHRGRTIVVVDGTVDPDAVVEVVERIAASASSGGGPAAMVVASVRPGGEPEPGDDERWLDASDVADELGVELLEWFVIGRERTWCPRDLLGEAPRW